MKLLSFFFEDCRQGKYEILAVLPSHLLLAEELIAKHGMNRECQTYDAIQLAVALTLKDQGDLQAFVTADKSLLALAVIETIPVLNPESP